MVLYFRIWSKDSGLGNRVKGYRSKRPRYQHCREDLKIKLANHRPTSVDLTNYFSELIVKSLVFQHSSWSRRLRLYNQFVQGNAELLSISSDDSIWNSEDDEGWWKPRVEV